MIDHPAFPDLWAEKANMSMEDKLDGAEVAFKELVKWLVLANVGYAYPKDPGQLVLQPSDWQSLKEAAGIEE